jgi:hypothetical protein
MFAPGTLTVATPLLATLLMLASCAPQPAPVSEPPLHIGGAPAAQPHPDDFRGLDASDRSVGAAAGHDARAALLGGSPILWDDLLPTLAEAAGAQALQEAVLDRMLADQTKVRGLSINASDIAAERTLLIDSITHDSKTTPADAERLLDQVRRTRGLGDYRFDRLLERNARMRKLVAGTVTVSDEEIDQAFQMSHGPKYRPRVILSRSQRDAAEMHDQLSALPPSPPATGASSSPSGNLSVHFAELALKRSIDPSAPAGGLLDPISPADPAYPAAARQALERLNVGELSPVIAVDRGFAIVLLEEKVPADGTRLPDATPQIRAELQKRHERLAMDDLARSLLRSAKLSILDRDLDWSWKAAGPRLAP